MDYLVFLNRVNMKFGKRYLKLYKSVRKRKLLDDLAARILDDSMAVGENVESLVSGGWDGTKINSILKNIYRSRYIVKVLTKAHMCNTWAGRNYMVSSYEIEEILKWPVSEMSRKPESETRQLSKDITSSAKELSKKSMETPGVVTYDPDGFGDLYAEADAYAGNGSCAAAASADN